MWFGHPDNDCARVSTIGVINNTGYVEFGWSLGWNSGGGAYSGSDACDSSYVGDLPQLFLVWQLIGGQYHCKLLIQIGTDQSVTLWIHDQNLDSVWGVEYAGSGQIGSANVNFDRGIAITNGERHSTTDSMHAEFRSLQVQLAGNGATWYDFNGSYQWLDNDASFHWVKHSNTYTEVNHD